MSSLKKKICVTVFLDELFEVVDEPTKKFHAQKKNIPTVASKRRESASKTSFAKKFSGPFDGKLRSWSENYFVNRDRLKIKKSRGCKPKLPVSVIKELDKLESKANERLEINKTNDSFDDEWSRAEAKASDVGETSDNFSEFSEEERLASDKSTQVLTVCEVEKIVEPTKSIESRESVQKTEKSEKIKIDEVPVISEEDILRHSLCSDVIKRSLEELFRRKDSAFEKSLMSVRDDSEAVLNDWQFNNQEKILCYAVQVEMPGFDKIATVIPSCLIKEKQESMVVGLDDKEIQTDDEDIEISKTETVLFEKINKIEIGMINVLEFKQIASIAYEGLSPLPKSYERKEIVIEDVPKSDLEGNESSMTVLCTISLEDLCDQNDVRIVIL